MEKNPKVFISYAHCNSEYENKILHFSNKLRAEGIDASVDLYEESPAYGWPRWMENEINCSDFVLVVASEEYSKKFYESGGKGVSWEVNIIYQILYNQFSISQKFIPIFFDDGDEEFIPNPLKGFTYYNVGTHQGYEKLYRRLRGITWNEKPELGKLRSLPEKEQKTMFFSTPIELDKWNKSCWKGMLYLFPQGEIPILGLVFENYESAKSIFNKWKSIANDGYIDEFVRLSYVIPPFPTNFWIYSDADRNFGKGYFVHIGPNIDNTIMRATTAGMNPSEMFIGTLSRYQWMDEFNGSSKRELFRKLIESGTPFILLPVGIKDKNKIIDKENLIINFDYAVKLRTVDFYKGIELNESNPCKVVLQG